MSPLLLRESRLIRILWAFPFSLAFLLFITAWFTLLDQPSGSGARAQLRFLGRYYPLPAEATRWVFLLVGTLFVLAFAAKLARIIWSASSKSLSISDGGIIATYGKRSIALAPAALTGVRVSRLLVGTRIRLNRETPPFILTLADTLRFAQAMEHLGVAYRSNDLPSPNFPLLDADETVIWEGRPGLRALTLSWWLVAILAVPAPLIFVAWLWEIWTGRGHLIDRLLFTYLALFTIGFTAIYIVTIIVSRFGEWSRDLAGTIAITDKRIAWRTPRTGDVYREINGCDILSAALVEVKGQRGWIGLSIRRARGRVEEIDLFNLPRPDEAIAAIEALMQPRD